MLTQEILKCHLQYIPETGIFIWVNPTSFRVAKGSEAGSLSPTGYLTIRLFGKLYQAHRLAWLYMTGEMPSKHIDHINCNKADNRFKNLREATNAENVMNSGIRSNNTSGFKGVKWNKNRNKWVADCTANGKRHYLGYFSKIDDAVEAYKQCAMKIHGEFFYEPV